MLYFEPEKHNNYRMYYYSPDTSQVPLVDPGVCPAHATPVGPNSFVFAYIFVEKHPCWKSTPPLMGPRPPTGNPGSATGFNTYVHLTV